MKATKAIKKTLTSDSFYAIEAMWLNVYSPSGWKIEQHLQYVWSWRRMKWQYQLVITFGDYKPLLRMETKVTIAAIITYCTIGVTLQYFKVSSSTAWCVGLIIGQFFGIGMGKISEIEKRKNKI